MPKCRFCGEVKSLVDAHVIPKSFYVPLIVSGDSPIVVHPDPNVTHRQAQAGIIDSSILCEACEKRFDKPDKIGHKFFMRPNWVDAMRLYRHGDLDLIRFPFSEVEELWIFVLAVVLRAHWSTQPFFRAINIGKHEDRIRTIVMNGFLEDPTHYQILISKFFPVFDGPDPAQQMHSPIHFRIEGVNFIELSWAGFSVLVKIDSRPFSRDLAPFVVSCDQHVSVLLRSFSTSKEYAQILRVANSRRVRDHNWYVKQRDRQKKIEGK